MKNNIRKVGIIICFILQIFCLFDIFNTNQKIYYYGIKNKGIDYIVPKRLTAESYEELALLMEKTDAKKFQNSYKKEKEYYVLKNNNKDLEEKLIVPEIIHYYIYNALQYKSSTEETLGITNAPGAYNVLKGLNKTFMTVVNRIENTNAILEKILGVQTGEEPINIQATIKRNNRLALTMSRTALGRLTLSLMTKAIAQTNTKQQNLAHSAIEAGTVYENQYIKEGLIRRIGEKFESLKSLTEMFSQNVETMNETILQQKAIYTEETNITITKIIPSRLQIIGNLINQSNEHLSALNDKFESYINLSMLSKEGSEDINSQISTVLGYDGTTGISDFINKSIDNYNTVIEISNTIDKTRLVIPIEHNLKVIQLIM